MLHVALATRSAVDQQDSSQPFAALSAARLAGCAWLLVLMFRKGTLSYSYVIGMHGLSPPLQQVTLRARLQHNGGAYTVQHARASMVPCWAVSPRIKIDQPYMCF